MSIDRMAEAQDDWQAALKVLAKVQPSGNCILAGCESNGAAGWVRMRNENGQPEVFEVKAGDGAAEYLKLVEDVVTAENSDGETVTVRVERHLEWVVNAPATGKYCTWAGLPRMLAKMAKQDDAVASYCSGGLWWHVPTNGTRLNVQRIGGRTHLQGSVKYGLLLTAVGVVTYTGRWASLAADNNITKTQRDDIPVLPTGYHPDGDIMIPIKYNGTPGFAVVDSDGRILISQEPELGDTLEINTWLDV